MNAPWVISLTRRIGGCCIALLVLLAAQVHARGPIGATPGVDTITVAHPRALQRVTDARTFLSGLTPVNVYTVTSTLDLPDDSIDDGIFFPQTFRSAIENANRNPDYDMIVFALSGASLGITSQLPALSQPCLINGAGTGTSPVVIDGTAAGAVPGVWINADGCVVRNLEIRNFNGAGLVVGSTTGHRDMIVQNVRTHHNNGAGININELKHSLIGGTAPNEKNIIYSNTGTGGHGISITGIFMNNDSNVVIGNWVGSTTGFDSAGNSRVGIRLESGKSNIISNNIVVANEYGDVSVGEDNIHTDIGNVVEYNLIGVAGDGVTPLVDLGTTSVGIQHTYSRNDTIQYNVIAGYPSECLNIGVDATHFLIDSNLVGTSWDTTQTINAGFEAMLIWGRGHEIRGNLINGSNRGISLRTGADSNKVQGNWCGRRDGYLGLTANSYGIFVQGPNNLIGGPNPDDANIISWNANGIWMRNSACSSNVIQNNTIGLNRARTDSIPNGFNGIVVTQRAARNRIIGNVIGANHGTGIAIQNQGTQAPRDNVIQGNYVGVSPVGMVAFPNEWGVAIDSAFNTLVGGYGLNEYNTIANSVQEGVWIDADSNHILNNTIVANGSAGINVAGGAYNEIRLNIIDGNGQLGIDLGGDGVTANDGPDDLDAGANTLQNYPVIDSIRSGGSDSVFGYLDAVGSTTYMLDFYVSAGCDPTGYGEGEFWRDSLPVTTNASGVANFALDITGAFAGPEKFLTITATDPEGNTSEFCRCDTITAPGTVIPDTVDIRVAKTADLDTVTVGDSVFYSITVKNGGPAVATGIVMQDTMPAGMTYLQYTSTLGSCTYAGNVLTCNFASLASGDSTVVVIATQAASPGNTRNKAVAGAAQAEAAPADNKDSADVLIEAAVGVHDDHGTIPAIFALGANYPNPFNPSTQFTYDLPEASRVQLVVYNVLGQRVRTLEDSRRAAGRHNVEWNGRNDAGEPVSSGVYLYRLQAGSFVATRRMILLK